MTFKEYKQKRKFPGKEKTTEPKDSKTKKSRTPTARKPIFVIHRHDASHLHFDLRLEMDGVLKSWAVPKSPEALSTKGTKRLAIHVEDHPLSYKDFEGTIPEGNYGAGKVEIWDNGTYELKEKEKKKIEFTLHGKKLDGDYVLVKTNYGSKPEKSWLFFRV
ncbi:MAG: DNA polymerase ligase N-terminal domain-containing protein [Candidatus Pacearchaeota archaeon]